MTITFEVKNGAYSPEKIHEDVIARIYNTLGPLASCAIDDLRNMDLAHYYMDQGKGAKVTRPIKRILTQAFGKEMVDTCYPEICKKISELYMPKMEVTASWGDKSELGAGHWEGMTTCFANGGCNELSRVFLEKFKRAKMLTLEVPDGRARCIAYFAGGRQIFVSNFYWRGSFPQNKLLFVEALRRLLKLPKISYKKADFPLPIYQNNDGLMCHPERSWDYQGTVMAPCPVCNRKTPLCELHTGERGNTCIIACSSDCASHFSGEICDRCEEHINGNVYDAPGGGTLCEYCHDEYTAYCDSCNSTVWMDDYLGDGYCSDCGFYCDNCHQVHSKSSHCNSVDGQDFCSDCYCDLFIDCVECGEPVKREEALTVDDEDYCDYCHDRYFASCDDCGKEQRKEEMEGDLCKDCHEAREDDTEDAISGIYRPIPSSQADGVPTPEKGGNDEIVISA